MASSENAREGDRCAVTVPGCWSMSTATLRLARRGRGNIWESWYREGDFWICPDYRSIVSPTYSCSRSARCSRFGCSRRFPVPTSLVEQSPNRAAPPKPIRKRCYDNLAARGPIPEHPPARVNLSRHKNLPRGRWNGVSSYAKASCRSRPRLRPHSQRLCRGSREHRPIVVSAGW